mmetsp:Transcript_77955/g.215526  ORF Transcript_77955/g.215526 Transcript_77955/m.215526 type:complete len:477 (-) Transcript_77955:272-1702(-)
MARWPPMGSEAALVERNTFIDVEPRGQALPARSQSDSQISQVEQLLSAGMAGDAASPEDTPATSPEAPRKRRAGASERKRFQQSEVSFTITSGENLDEALSDALRKHWTGIEYLQTLPHLPQERSITLEIRARGTPVGIAYLVDFLNDGKFVTDAFVLEQFRSQSDIAEMIRWGLIWVFSRFSSVVRDRFPRIVDGRTSILAPLPNVDRTRSDLLNVLERLGFQPVASLQLKDLIDKVRLEHRDCAPLLNFSGRVWMMKGPCSLGEWMSFAAGLWPTKRSNADLYHQDAEAAAPGSPVRSKRLRRSAFSQQCGLTFEAEYGTLVVQAKNVDAAGVIPRSGLELEVAVHCKEAAMQLPPLEAGGPLYVEATATLLSSTRDTMPRAHGTRFLRHCEIPGGHCQLSQEAAHTPPIFSGNLTLVPQGQATGASAPSPTVEFTLKVTCRLHDGPPQSRTSTGCDLVSHIFQDSPERLFCRL